MCGCQDALPSTGHNIWLHGAADGDSCSFTRSEASASREPVDLPRRPRSVRRQMSAGSSDSLRLANLLLSAMSQESHSRRAKNGCVLWVSDVALPSRRMDFEKPKLRWDHSVRPKKGGCACCSCGSAPLPMLGSCSCRPFLERHVLSCLVAVRGDLIGSEEEIGMLEWDPEHGSMGDYPGPHAVLKGYLPISRFFLMLACDRWCRVSCAAPRCGCSTPWRQGHSARLEIVPAQ